MTTATPTTIVPDRRRIALRLLFGAAALALLAVAVTSLPGLDEVRHRLADAAPGWLGAALALEVGSCLAFVVVYRSVLCRRLPWRTSYEVGMAVQGTNVLVPAGGASGLAVGAWALRRAGVPGDRLASRTVAFFLITSSVNFVTAVLAGAALALGLLPGDASLALALGPAALAAVTMAAVLVLPRILATTRWRAGRALADGVLEARALVRAGRAPVIAGAIGYMALDVAALAAAFAAIGTVPPLGAFLLAYVLGQLGGLIPLPGGVGGADSGVIGALVLFGTALPEAAAAVLAYRAFQLGIPAVLGAISLVRLPGVVGREDLGGRVVAFPAAAPSGARTPLAA